MSTRTCSAGSSGGRRVGKRQPGAAGRWRAEVGTGSIYRRPAPRGRHPGGSLGHRGPRRPDRAARDPRPVRGGDGRAHRGPAPGGGVAGRRPLHRGRRRFGQDPGPDPAGGAPYRRRLGRGRPHRRVHVHPKGGPRAAGPARPLRGAGVDPGRAGRRALTRRPGRHAPPAGPHPAPTPRRRHRRPTARTGRAPLAHAGRPHRRSGRGVGRRDGDRVGQGPLRHAGGLCDGGRVGGPDGRPAPRPGGGRLRRLPGPPRPPEPAGPRRRPAPRGRPAGGGPGLRVGGPTGATATSPWTNSRT